MTKASSKKPKNLAEAIEQLEAAASQKADHFSQVLDELKPYLHQVKEQAEASAKENLKDSFAKAQNVGHEIDEQVHKRPWMAIGVFAFVAFLIGLLIGKRD